MEKKFSYVYRIISPIIIFFCLTHCRKETSPLNVILYDKPLAVIQSHIQGKWKCIYGKGGIGANTIQYYDDYYWTFTNNKVMQSYKGDIVTDATIQWIWDRGAYGDSTFIMKFYDQENVPWNYIVSKVQNDTLILRGAYSFDAYHYYFIKL